jgi:hypothetical protein
VEPRWGSCVMDARHPRVRCATLGCDVEPRWGSQPTTTLTPRGLYNKARGRAAHPGSQRKTARQPRRGCTYRNVEPRWGSCVMDALISKGHSICSGCSCAPIWRKASGLAMDCGLLHLLPVHVSPNFSFWVERPPPPSDFGIVPGLDNDGPGPQQSPRDQKFPPAPIS